MPREHSLDPGQGMREQIVALSDGRRLRAVTAGEKPGPLVVFEAGMSAPAGSWIHTQREISAHTRTLAYDRAGYGGSDVDRRDRTLERIVDDLTALLDQLDESGPVVLVGHSWGGPVIRLFADRNPQRVAGLVLVDATVAEITTRTNAILAGISFRVLSVLATIGAKGVIERMAFPHGVSGDITEPDLVTMLRDYACARAMRAGRREAAQIAPAIPTLWRLQATGGPDVPTVCLQGGRVDRGMAATRRLLNRTATDLMSVAPNGKVLIVKEAGHLIPQECPAPVRDAILDVVDEAKETRTDS